MPDLAKERPLIDMFINEIYLYGDWLVIPCNRKDGAETIALEDTAPPSGCCQVRVLSPEQ